MSDYKNGVATQKQKGREGGRMPREQRMEERASKLNPYKKKIWVHPRLSERVTASQLNPNKRRIQAGARLRRGHSVTAESQ